MVSQRNTDSWGNRPLDTTPPASSGDDGAQFVVVVSNAFNSITSSPPALLRIGGAPVVTSQPQSLIVTRGDNASFAVTVSSATPPTFQWRFNGGDIPGATSPTFTVTNASPGNAGTYDVVVANGSGPVTSTPATLTVRRGFR
jgi:hypothetical protein